MNDSMHQIPELRMDPTFSESSSDRSNATPLSNNKRKPRSKSKKDKEKKHEDEEAAQQRRCHIITILSSIPFVLSLVSLLIVLTKDEDNQTTMSAASTVLDETETDHQIRPVSNTQSQTPTQPNDPPQSNDDKTNDYLTYDEVTTSNISPEKCHEVEIVSMFTTWNLLKRVGSGFQSVESSFEMASNSNAVDDETLCLEEGEYVLMAMISGDEGLYRITSNGMLIGEGQDERTSFSIPFVPRVQGKSAKKAPFIDTRSPLVVDTSSPSDDSMVELVGESIKTAVVENDIPTYSPTSWYPTYSPTSDMPTYSPSTTTTTHDPISDMPSYSPPTSKYVLSAAKTRDPISDMPTYSPSDSVRHPTYEPTSQSTDTYYFN